MKNENKAFDAALEVLIDEAARQVGMQESQAVAEAAQAQEDACFSEAHCKKMQRIFRSEKRKRHLTQLSSYAKKIACVFMIAILISCVAICSVEAWRAKFINFVFRNDLPNTDYQYTDNQGSSYHNDRISVNYIPANFSIEYDHSTTRDVDLRFVYQESYFSLISSEADMRHSVDTENAVVEILKIDAYDIYCISKENLTTLVWEDGRYSYVLYGNIPKQELIKIAKKINI